MNVPIQALMAWYNKLRCARQLFLDDTNPDETQALRDTIASVRDSIYAYIKKESE